MGIRSPENRDTEFELIRTKKVYSLFCRLSRIFVARDRGRFTNIYIGNLILAQDKSSGNC